MTFTPSTVWMLITTLLVVAGGLLFYRRLSRGHGDIATTDFMQL